MLNAKSRWLNLYDVNTIHLQEQLLHPKPVDWIPPMVHSPLLKRKSFLEGNFFTLLACTKAE